MHIGATVKIFWCISFLYIHHRFQLNQNIIKAKYWINMTLLTVYHVACLLVYICRLWIKLTYLSKLSLFFHNNKSWMLGGMVMVFNATFNNISVISWRSILLEEKTGVPGENHRPKNKYSDSSVFNKKCW